MMLKPFTKSDFLFQSGRIVFMLFLSCGVYFSVVGQEKDSLRKVSDYQVYFARIIHPASDTLYALRRFKLDSQSVYLVFNPEKLRTSLVNSDSVRAESLDLSAFQQILKMTPFGQCLQKERASRNKLQGAGLRNGSDSIPGIFLTVDLCPSEKPLTRELFTAIIDTFGPEQGRVPVSIAITGSWIKTHQPDLGWLLRLNQDSLLRITWVNHTLHHRFKPDLPLKENFILEKNTNLAEEILGNEKLMIRYGLVPSIFFRFPGLVSDPAVFDTVIGYGLLPLGSDAWLAKGQLPKRGSVVLVHGNNNEPLGITKFMELLRENSALIRDRKWLLMDLDGKIGISGSAQE